ncbi:MAG: helix-turn-helix transcriptional regulator [Acidobacteriota bacterium]
MKYKSSKNDFIKMSGTSEDLPGWISGYPEFHIQVKAIREFQKISQQKLAENVGLTWRSIPNIESGKVNPKISTLKKIAEFLNCELKILLIPGKGFTKPDTLKSITTKPDPLSFQKDLTFENSPQDDNAKKNQDDMEKKKEYFWD